MIAMVEFERIFVKDSIPIGKLKEIILARSSEFIKAVVDINKEIMAIGAELHVDDEQFLLANGSGQEDLWGINIYPELDGEDMIEFDSMVNIRPMQNNRSRYVESPDIRDKICSVVNKLITD